MMEDRTVVVLGLKVANQQLLVEVQVLDQLVDQVESQ